MSATTLDKAQYEEERKQKIKSAPTNYRRPDILWFCFVSAIRGPIYATLFSLAVFPLWRYLFVESTFALWLNATFSQHHASLITFFLTAHVPREIIMVSFYLFFHFFEGQPWLEKYRIDKSGEKKGPTPKLRRMALIHIIKQHFFIQPLMSIVIFSLFASPEASSVTTPLPGLTMLLVYFVVRVIVNDILFWVFHRTLHIPYLYKWIHIYHHHYHYPRFESADYAHPHETWLWVALPILLQVTSQDHMFLYGVVAAWSVWVNYEMHCGFNFGDTFLSKRLGLLSATMTQFHDHHHTDHMGYGWSMLTDYFAGTMGEFLAIHPPSKLQIVVPWDRSSWK